jgi:hypothetical protein
MGTQETMIMLVSVEAMAHINPEDSLEDRLRSAMRASVGHWAATDEQMQLAGAVAAVLTHKACSEDDKERLTAEVKVLQALASLQSGIPVDMAAVMERYQVSNHEPIGLSALWREVRAETES